MVQKDHQKQMLIFQVYDPKKRIVLYDTLIKDMTIKELV